MGRCRLSIRGLILAVLLAGFDLAVMVRAVQQGRAAGSTREYATGFGLVLLALNLLLLGLGASFARPAAGAPGRRLRATPSPLLIAGLYLVLMALAVLSVLFLSGRF